MSNAASLVPSTGPHVHVARRTLLLVPISQSQDICLWAHDKEAPGSPIDTWPEPEPGAQA